MTEHDKARPVSGEIMAGGTDDAATARRGDFTDAEFESLAGDPPRRQAAAAPTREPVRGMDFLKGGAVAEPRESRHGGPAFWAGGLVIVFGAFWMSGGHAVVAKMPQFRQVEKPAPLHIADVRSRIENRDGRAVLFVEGTVENRSAGDMALPPLSISVHENDGPTTSYILGTNGSVLKPGDRYTFSSRLIAPSNGVKSVSVTFAEGQI